MSEISDRLREALVSPDRTGEWATRARLAFERVHAMGLNPRGRLTRHAARPSHLRALWEGLQLDGLLPAHLEFDRGPWYPDRLRAPTCVAEVVALAANWPAVLRATETQNELVAAACAWAGGPSEPEFFVQWRMLTDRDFSQSGERFSRGSGVYHLLGAQLVACSYALTAAERVVDQSEFAFLDRVGQGDDSDDGAFWLSLSFDGSRRALLRRHLLLATWVDYLWREAAKIGCAVTSRRVLMGEAPSPASWVIATKSAAGS
jgi:hypothetical protein